MYSKYRNKRVVVDGIKFDSIKESERYSLLKIAKEKGGIKDFQMQVPFRFMIDGKLMFTYKLDFMIEFNDGSFKYEDVKPFDIKSGKYLSTDVFKLKRKIIEANYNIKIELF